MSQHVLDAALASLPRIALAHLPTPLIEVPALSRRLGVDLWIKRDDASSGAEAGNKIRKLELLLARAVREGADVVLTCGGIQSNHARATALCAARLGLRCVLFLRVADLTARLPDGGNVLLDRLAGAEIHPITHAQYRERDQLMADAAATLRRLGQRPYVIPEGGSDGLGALGYALAMREVRDQLAVGLGGARPYDVVVHACGSGGTAAGCVLAAKVMGVAPRVRTMAVCDDAAYFERRVGAIMAESREWLVRQGAPADAVAASEADWTVDDHARGPAYGVATDEQRRFLVEVSRLSGLVLDPVYTGKAFHGLSRAISRGDVTPGSRVLFIHTGGLPGVLANPEVFEDAL